MEALRIAFLHGLVAIALVGPLVWLAGSGRGRAAVVALALAGGVAGALFAYAPAGSRLPMETVLLKGGTAWAGLCLLLAVMDVTVLGTLRRRYPAVRLGMVLALAATILPLDGIDLVRQVRTLVFMKETSAPWAWAGLGLLAAAASGWLISWVFRRFGARRYATMWSYLLVAPVVRLAIQPSVIPNLESIVSRVAHDGMHVLVLLIQLPDHAYLSSGVWTAIGLVFMSTTGLLLNVAVYVGVAAFVLVRQASKPLPLREDENPAQRRRRWTTLKTQRRLTFLPIYVAMAMFAVLAYTTWAATGTPKTPTPATLPAGGIEVASLADGELHSYVFGRSSDKRVIAIHKPDGSYSVCLDACLVCPPDGYARFGTDLFCLYCGTPIPLGTVGQPGGCNPIPLTFTQSAGRLVFDQTQAEVAWQGANSGK